MKKKLILAILLIFLNIVVACSPSEPLLRLDQPLNLKVVKNIVSFDPVEFADYYILNINSINIELTETSYTIDESGTYRVQVKAVGENFTDSLFSTALTFEVKFLEYPKNIQVINRQITYDEVDGADSYNIDINGEIYNTKEKIVPTLEPGTYYVRIQSLSNQFVDSSYSPMIVLVLTELDLIITKNAYKYSLNSKFDLPLYKYTRDITEYNVYIKVDSLETKIDSKYLYVLENEIYLSQAYLSTLKKGDKITIELETNLGNHDITIDITDTHNPYTYSDSKVKFNMVDNPIFRIESFGLNFVDIVNLDNKEVSISKEDYDFIDGVVSIDSNYLNNLFESDLDKKEIAFMIRFEKDRNTHVILIVITR